MMKIWVTASTLGDTPELLETVWTEVQMEWSSVHGTKITTEIKMVAIVQNFGKEHGGSIGNCLNWHFKSFSNIKARCFSCFNAHLNGEYYTSPEDQEKNFGIVWSTWLGYDYSLKSSTMIILKVWLWLIVTRPSSLHREKNICGLFWICDLFSPVDPPLSS